jgi:hypothetical protein
MTKQLVAFLKAKTSYTLIPPGAAEGMRFQIISEDVSISERLLLVETGKRLHADAVISGTIYRFRQRIGTVFSVDTPASVAFGIHLIRVADGRLIWGRHFDETQHGLSENLFKLGTFLDRGGEMALFRNLCVNLRDCLCDVPLVRLRAIPCVDSGHPCPSPLWVCLRQIQFRYPAELSLTLRKIAHF